MPDLLNDYYLRIGYPLPSVSSCIEYGLDALREAIAERAINARYLDSCR